MRLVCSSVHAEGILITCWQFGRPVGHAFLYILRNCLHEEPFGFMENVFVEPKRRGEGIGERLVKRVIEKARERGCYKLVAASRRERPKVHALYLKLGFSDRGKEFRIDL